MTTITQAQVGQTFIVPADNDGVTYEVREDGVYAIDAHSNESGRIDASEFGGAEIEFVAHTIGAAAARLTIDTANRIALDGQATGLAVTQRRDGTVVYTPESVVSGTSYAEHKMPHARYSLAHDAPASSAAGRAQFEADIRALRDRL